MNMCPGLWYTIYLIVGLGPNFESHKPGEAENESWDL